MTTVRILIAVTAALMALVSIALLALMRQRRNGPVQHALELWFRAVTVSAVALALNLGANAVRACQTDSLLVVYGLSYAYMLAATVRLYVTIRGGWRRP